MYVFRILRIAFVYLELRITINCAHKKKDSQRNIQKVVRKITFDERYDDKVLQDMW